MFLIVFLPGNGIIDFDEFIKKMISTNVIIVSIHRLCMILLHDVYMVYFVTYVNQDIFISLTT